MVSLSLGASMAMCITLDKPFTIKDLKIPCQCHALQDLYYIFPYTQTAGMVLKWFRNEFFSEGMNNKSFQEMDLLAAEVNPGSDGLIMIPHLMGSGSPEFNPHARAAFYGMSLSTTKGHFIRAILEAVAFTIEHNLSTMRKKGIAVHQIQLLGGGSQSPLWSQIIADVTGIPIITLKNTENAAIGAAILAGVGSGIFKDLKQTAGNFLEIRDKYTAIPGNYKIYQGLFLRYLELSV
jgi:xylulokinase